MSAVPGYVVRWHLSEVTGGKDIVVTLPIKTVSEANSRSHYMAKARRASRQRQPVKWACGPVLAEYRDGLAKKYLGTMTVLLERIAPSGGLDDDNLRSSLKAVRDGVADALEINDRDPRVEWQYAQSRGKKGVYEVRITVKGTSEPLP